MQGVGGLEARTRLQPVSEQKEGHNEGGTVDEDHAVTKVVAGKGRENDRHAPKVGRAGTERDEDVHVGRTPSHGAVGTTVEASTGPGPDDASEHQGDEVVHAHTLRCKGAMAVHAHQPARAEVTEIREPHGQQHAGGRGHKRPGHALSSAAEVGLALPPSLKGVHGSRCTEPATIDGLDDLVEGGGVVQRDHGALEGQVHADGLDAFDAHGQAFDAGHASTTGHAVDVKAMYGGHAHAPTALQHAFIRPGPASRETQPHPQVHIHPTLSQPFPPSARV